MQRHARTPFRHFKERRATRRVRFSGGETAAFRDAVFDSRLNPVQREAKSLQIVEPIPVTGPLRPRRRDLAPQGDEAFADDFPEISRRMEPFERRKV
jgi:hypothetical protein